MKFKSIPPTGHRLFFKDLIDRKSIVDLSGYWFNSGTSALYFLLSKLYIPINSRIIIPAYSCPSVAAAVVRSGHQPVLCDIALDTLNYDTKRLKMEINSRSAKAVIWVNLFGLENDIPSLEIPIILDNAQVSPLDSSQRKIAGVIFSFGRGKPINTLEGGLARINQKDKFKDINMVNSVIKKNPKICSILYFYKILLYKIFYNPHLYSIPHLIPLIHLGETRYDINFKIRLACPINQIVVNNIINRYSKIREMRKLLCNQYKLIFNKYRDKILIYNKNDFFRYPILFLREGLRDKILKELNSRGITASGLYPYPLNKQKGLSGFLNDPNKYVNADYISRNIMTLPINEFVTNKIILNIKKVFEDNLA